METANWYEIHVQSHLDESMANAFQGMTVYYEAPDETILVGPVVDQAALHGLLMRIRDLGLPLLEVRRIEAPPELETPL